MSVDDWTKIVGLGASFASLVGIGFSAYRQRHKIAADERFLEAVGRHDAATRTADALDALDLPDPVKTEVAKKLDLQRTDNDLKLYRAIAAYEWNKTRQADRAFGLLLAFGTLWFLAIMATLSDPFPGQELVALLCALIGIIALIISLVTYSPVRERFLDKRSEKLAELAGKKHLGIVAPNLPAPDKTNHTVRDWLRRHLIPREHPTTPASHHNQDQHRNAEQD